MRRNHITQQNGTQPRRPLPRPFHLHIGCRRTSTSFRFAKVGVGFPPSSSTVTSILPSLHPEGTLQAGDPLPSSVAVLLLLLLCQTQRRETGTAADSASLSTHTHALSPFAKFSTITLPPWFVPHHLHSSSPPCSLFLVSLLSLSSVTPSSYLILLSFSLLSSPSVSFVLSPFCSPPPHRSSCLYFSH